MGGPDVTRRGPAGTRGPMKKPLVASRPGRSGVGRAVPAVRDRLPVFACKPSELDTSKTIFFSGGKEIEPY